MHNIPHTDAAKKKMRESHSGVPLPHKRRPMKVIDGIEHYRCSRCGNFYPKDGFYKNKKTILGITSECKKCHCKTSFNSRNKELARKRNKEYMRRAVKENPEKFRACWRGRPSVKDDRYIARKSLNCAVKRGDITKPELCVSCGLKKKLTAHHDDYSQPLKVRWLCYECHGKLHRQTS